MDNKPVKPEWAPENAGGEFASSVLSGVNENDIKKNMPSVVKKSQLSAKEYAEGILAGDRGILSRAITIIESNAPKHFDLGQEIISLLLPYTGNSVRVGITGVPGAGKSTTIEALGNFLCDNGRRVAVLAVDPSSSVSRGSILGDKTRMENLSKRQEAFIRPSPSGGTLGGVTRKSRETILLCEAAGFDTILVETVGVGQSEITVRSMVDFFLVLVITGAGDELQGIKKGIIEIADSVLINKADGDNKRRALVAKSEYNQVLHYLRPATEGWTTQAYTCSALTGEGIEDMWNIIMEFIGITKESGIFHARRNTQTINWVRQMAESYAIDKVFGNPSIKQAMENMAPLIKSGGVSPSVALKQLIDAMEREMFRSEGC